MRVGGKIGEKISSYTVAKLYDILHPDDNQNCMDVVCIVVGGREGGSASASDFKP